MTKKMLISNVYMRNQARTKSYTISARFALDGINYETIVWSGDLEDRDIGGKIFHFDTTTAAQVAYQGPSREAAIAAYRKLVAAKTLEGYKAMTFRMPKRISPYVGSESRWS